jgi:hypothetical protein
MRQCNDCLFPARLAYHDAHVVLGQAVHAPPVLVRHRQVHIGGGRLDGAANDEVGTLCTQAPEEERRGRDTGTRKGDAGRGLDTRVLVWAREQRDTRGRWAPQGHGAPAPGVKLPLWLSINRGFEWTWLVPLDQMPTS